MKLRHKFFPDPSKTELTSVQYFQDRFTISSRILGGGIGGDVFLAHETGTSKQLACKVVMSRVRLQRHSSLSQEATQTPENHVIDDERKKQLREVEILSKLNHVGNIVLVQVTVLTAHSQTLSASRKHISLTTDCMFTEASNFPLTAPDTCSPS
jgi:serine/threonine protein kinase